MPKINYLDKNFSESSLKIITIANKIIEDYMAQGYDLTLRQLYYQFVARDLISNKQTEYKRLGSIINDARLAGLIDWDTIVDRTRNVQSNAHWESPKEIVESCAKQFEIDKWETQEHYVEVWIEKDALVGVIENVCRRNDVSFFSCRGYTSQSEMWGASQRLLVRAKRYDQKTIIIHLGDHDPSGIDMTRDIQDRLSLFMRSTHIEVHRIALNMEQVEQYDPPPTQAKITDSRAEKYIQQYGGESWEIDELEPKVLEDLIDDKIAEFKDEHLWAKAVRKQNKHIATLTKAAKAMK